MRELWKLVAGQSGHEQQPPSGLPLQQETLQCWLADLPASGTYADTDCQTQCITGDCNAMLQTRLLCPCARVLLHRMRQ